jgi:hypothetical protein
MSASLKQDLIDLDTLMKNLKRSMANIPVHRAGLKRLHDNAANAAANLAVELRHATPRVR